MKAIIINRAADCSIKKFMEAYYDGKLKSLLTEGNAPDEELKEALEIIYAEYVDISMMYQTREFEMNAYIHWVGMRIMTMKNFFELTRAFIREFNLPYLPGFEMIKQYGHRLYFNPEYPDIEGFVNKLDSMEQKEKKWDVIIDVKVKELIAFKKKQINKELDPLQSRKQFLQTIIRLQQKDFVITKTETTMEDLAIMIKEDKDAAEDAHAHKKFKRK